jgi:hypothetical protein
MGSWLKNPDCKEMHNSYRYGSYSAVANGEGNTILVAGFRGFHVSGGQLLDKYGQGSQQFICGLFQFKF